MDTLRQLYNKIIPSGHSLTFRQLQHKLSKKVHPSLRSVLTEGSHFRFLHTASFTLVQQNMALLPGILYKGTDRAASVDALIGYLNRIKPDVVGLSECFVDEERKQIHNAVKVLYPFLLIGPTEDDLEQDGGLLLLSQHPIVDQHQTIYRQAMGEDALTNKGALHVRIRVAGHPTDYDIFLSHTQSPNPLSSFPNIGLGSDAISKIKLQIEHLAAFVAAYSDIQRPAFLMGDLNINGLDAALYLNLINTLQPHRDLWKVAGIGVEGISNDANNNKLGITFERDIPKFSSFFPEIAPMPVNHPDRYKNGFILDYTMNWQSARFSPLFFDTNILVLQVATGRDISDHYGMKVQQSFVGEVALGLIHSFTGVQIRLINVRCLTETGNPTSKSIESDEMEFELRFQTENGKSGSQRKVRIEGINSGSVFEFRDSLKLNVDDPGAFLDIIVEGWEVDEGLGIETGRVRLGPEKIQFRREDLLLLKGTTSRQTLPLLLGDGGEYAVTVEITVH